MFEAESALHASLLHAHVVRAYGAVAGVCPVTGLPEYRLVMERLACSLEDLLALARPAEGRPPQPLSTREAVDVCMGLVEGVRYLHHRGVVHGDLRPGNALCSDRLVAKVSDLGGAGTAGTGPLDPVNGVYCAPERRPPPEGVGAHTRARHWDAWSVGVIVGEVLAGGPRLGGHDGERPHAWSAVSDAACARFGLDGEGAVVKASLRQLLERLHSRDPAARPDLADVAVLLQRAARTPAYVQCPPRRGVRVALVLDALAAPDAGPRRVVSLVAVDEEAGGGDGGGGGGGGGGAGGGGGGGPAGAPPPPVLPAEVAEEPPLCVLCMECILDNDVSMALPCGHVFHGTEDCLLRWLALVPQCPLCRARVPPDDE